jgi:hypothetical protein
MITRIEAINTMLAAIRESPIDSLLSPLPDAASLANQVLGEIQREVLRMGWAFNTDLDVALTPDPTSTQIVLGSDLLKIEFDTSCLPTTIKPVLRGNRVYNRYGGTYTFTAALTAKRYVRMLAWEHMPDTARRYITLRAARTFVSRILPSDQAERAAGREEMLALRELARDANDVAPANMLRSPGIQELADRRGVWL